MLKSILTIISASTIVAEAVGFIIGLPIVESKDYRYVSGTASYNNTVITDDGNVWDYTHIYYAPTEVTVVFDDNWTPDDIYDDIIIDVYSK